MKKKTRSVLCAVLSLIMLFGMSPVSAEAASVKINASNFPDESLRKYVSDEYDTNGDGRLSATEIKAATDMEVSDKGIASLTGIELLTSLTRIYAWGNSITEVDVSKNIALEYLYLDSNALTSIDVSKNTNLQSLNISYNALTKIDLSKNKKLEYLGCSGNALNTLDVTNNSNLTNLSCGSNALTSLDVSQNKNLSYLECSDNQLSELNVSSNPMLTSLYCWGNNLKNLDLSKNAKLSYLNVENNELGTLDLSNNSQLVSLMASSCGLEEIDLSKNIKLETLYLSDNNLEQIDISQNKNLTDLSVASNALTYLDVSKNTKLTSITAGSNLLTNLDVSALSDLKSLYISDNDIFEVEEGKEFSLKSLLEDTVGFKNASKLAPGDLYYDESILSFDDNGRGKGLQTGTAYVSMYAQDYSANINVTIEVVETLDDSLSSISLPPTAEINAGDTLQLKITCNPVSAKEDITWKSENGSAIKVDSDGLITAVKPVKGDASGSQPGNIRVTATSESGKKATTKVTVYFNDVADPNTYYFKPVYWAFNNDITTGKSGGQTFAPDDTCTRAQIVTFLWRLAGKPEPKVSNPFTDIKSSAYYYKAVLWAYEKGITTGRSGGKTFDPNGTCTRREIVTFLWRYAGKPSPSETGKFTDVTDKNAYYYNAVYWAVEENITTGKAASNYTTFDPTGLCTRGMAVTFLYRYAR